MGTRCSPEGKTQRRLLPHPADIYHLVSDFTQTAAALSSSRPISVSRAVQLVSQPQVQTAAHEKV